VLGEHDRFAQDRDSPNRIRIRFNSVHVHPDYDSKTKANDIALVRLASTVQLTDYIHPACSPGAVEAYVGGHCIVSGWGVSGPGECGGLRGRALHRQRLGRLGAR
jgi:secreted trypsin-like serine protease